MSKYYYHPISGEKVIINKRESCFFYKYDDESDWWWEGCYIQRLNCEECKKNFQNCPLNDYIEEVK